MQADFPEILSPLLTLKRRYKVLWGGRGGLKSWGIARALVVKMATSKEPVRVLCGRETQKSIDESVHYLLAKQIGLLGLDSMFDVQQTKIIGPGGGGFRFAGIRQQGVTNLKSFEDVDICWIEEAEVVTKTSWDVLIPTIRKPGSEIWASFNPELDTAETYKRFITNPPPPEMIWSLKTSWRDNPWLSEELDAERRLMLARDPVGYRTTWEGECRPAVEGAIYAQEIDELLRAGRFTRVAHDPHLPAHTIWDLGYNDQTVILLVQRLASEIRVIGCLIRRFSTYEDDIGELRKLGAEWNITWGTDWLPHDARHKTKTANGKSAEDIVRGMNRNVRIVDQADIEGGIKLTRSTFPRLWIDKTCEDWLNALKRYRRHKSADGQKTGEPVHDDASHGADALRYLAQVAQHLGSQVETHPAIDLSSPIGIFVG